MAKPSSRGLAALLLLGAAPAAQVFVVDAANGPGAHFTSIAAAVAAVPDGAVLQVRAGTYAGFAITNKGLAVLAEPGVRVLDPALPTILVQGLQAHQTVALRGLDVSHPVGPARIECSSSAGAIVVDRCRADHNTAAQGGRLVAQGCAQLHVRACSFLSGHLQQSALTLSACDATVVGCDLGGLPSPILASGCRVDLVASRVTGVGFAPAIQLNGGELRIRGRTAIAGSVAVGFFALAVHGTGTVRVDPNTTLRNVPSPPFGPGLTVRSVAMPWLEATPGPPGGTSTLDLFGAAGGVGALAVGFPAPPSLLPGLADPAWILPGSEVLHAFGALPLRARHAVPNAPWVLGVTLCWQGVTLAPGSGLQLGNAAVYAH